MASNSNGNGNGNDTKAAKLQGEFQQLMELLPLLLMLLEMFRTFSEGPSNLRAFDAAVRTPRFIEKGAPTIEAQDMDEEGEPVKRKSKSTKSKSTGKVRSDWTKEQRKAARSAGEGEPCRCCSGMLPRGYVVANGATCKGCKEDRLAAAAEKAAKSEGKAEGTASSKRRTAKKGRRGGGTIKACRVCGVKFDGAETDTECDKECERLWCNARQKVYREQAKEADGYPVGCHKDDTYIIEELKIRGQHGTAA